ncbi:MAG: hypothetical protein RIS70_396 [Planctomycetota bacterium]
MLNRNVLIVSLLSTLTLAALGPRAMAEPTAAQIEFFETRIRPVLVEQCYACHNSSKNAEGGLAIDQRSATLRGGDGGPIIAPGKPAESRLLAILRHEVEGLKMPQGGAKLGSAELADFEKWIAMGAPDPRDQPPTTDELSKATSWEAVFEKRKKWWSLQPVRRVDPPVVKHPKWSEHPIDRFLLAKLEEEGLQPAARADKRTLLRRATFALTGLPPTPDEVQAFLADESPKAFEAVVDRLLNSPRFGERWARHWMDLVRYCESHGSQGDPELPNAYRYRDYLIRAFNADVPYDRFVREHLAGDLLTKPRWNEAENFNESAIGPAHLRMVELGFVPVDALDDQVKVVDNQIDVYSKAFLGLTASCARCHDHKFDAISQQDFYALYGIFVSSRPGQVLIDSPELLHKNQAELLQLKRRIRDELATAWLESAAALANRLRDHSRREAQIVDLTARLTRLRERIAVIEDAARAVVLKKRGQEGNGSLPTPDARWSFDGDARDRVGQHHGELLSGAAIRNGRLVLDGVGANMRTVPLNRDIHDKTLEAWVTLANLDQRGGGVIGLDTPEGRFFDSIVFGELNPRHWMAGSDFFNRSQDPGGEAEAAKPDELVHVAVVYAKDHSITVYRNGQRYGATYQKGTIRPFLKGQSRFLFGQRLSDINPPFAGEVDEARVYFRALAADEVAQSFRAGPSGVTEAELAEVLTSEQREQLASLTAEENRLQQALSASQSAQVDSWSAALADARSNNTNPLHLWHQFTADGTGPTAEVARERWQKLADFWRREMQTRREFNQSQFATLWDLRGEQQREWFPSGTGFHPPRSGTPEENLNADRAANNGEFTIEVEGDRVLRGIHPTAILTHGLSNRNTGVLLSPRFRIETDSVSVRAMGQNSMVRLVIENYPIGNGGIYPAARLSRDELGWLRLDTAYRKGSYAHFEFSTDPAERAFFGVAQVVASNHVDTPREMSVPIMGLFQGDPPASSDDLALRYADRLQSAVRAWQSQSLSDEDTALLDFFVRRDLLPTTLGTLPQLRELIDRYRQLEREIPVPRRAPGVLEAAAFDQPLFERGQLNRPSQPIPRSGLSLLEARPFVTKQSGRLQLAEQTASAQNPLTARVMVNRLWHHLFGRGIVGTVDNFGRLGDQPTHPELLDYLALRFAHDEQWSIKKMLRLMMMSQAWQQSSIASESAKERDGNNAWLSHMPVRRLEAEAIRDAILATSGQLNPTMFGPGVNVYFVNKTEGGGPKGPLDGDRRRSVYQRIRRNAFNPFLEVFDAPKPSTTRGRRDVTNVPAQALTMLNDPFVIDQSAKWAASLIADGATPEQRIRRMFAVALSREPDSDELRASLDYLTELANEHGVAGTNVSGHVAVWQDFAQSIFCLKEFLYVR